MITVIANWPSPLFELLLEQECEAHYEQPGIHSTACMFFCFEVSIDKIWNSPFRRAVEALVN